MLSPNSILFHVNIYHSKRLILSGLELNMISIITPATIGCRVMAHVPLSNSTKRSDNSVLQYYIGTAFHTKQGTMLYNPKTKQVIIRRSYQTLHGNDQTIPVIKIL